MGIFLGYTEVISGYVNFKPIYELRDGNLEQLSYVELSNLLPGSYYKSINFNRRGGERISNSYYTYQYLFLEFDPTELEENTDASGNLMKVGFKIDELKYRAGRKIHPLLSDFGYYVYIDIEDYEKNDDAKRIKIMANMNLHEGMWVVLQSEDKYRVYGPFELMEDADGFYVTEKSITENRLLKGWEFDEPVAKSTLVIRQETQFKLVHKLHTKNITEDIATDEYILKQFKYSLKSSYIEDNKLDLKKLDEAIDNYAKISLFSKGLGGQKEIKDSRIMKLRNILSNEKKLAETFKEISKIITDFISRFKNSEEYQDFLYGLADDSEFMAAIQNYKIIQEKIKDKQEDLKKLEYQKDTLEDEIQNRKDHAEEEIKKQNFKLLQTKSIYEKKLEQIKEELCIAEEIDSLENKRAMLQGAVEEKRRDFARIQSDTERIMSTFRKSLQDMTTPLAENILNPIITNEMLQVEANWKSDRQKQKIGEYAEKIHDIPVFKGNIKNEIYQRIHRYRNYKINEIYNILICICQGFITVFSGEPGTGKTSICNIISHTLGLTKINEQLSIKEEEYFVNRYIQVSVEKGWTSKRDLIGYYNPLTKTFDRSNRRLFEGLNMLDYEAHHENDSLPYLVLLDEANLSPMEYYWAEFMNLCDDRENNNLINLGEDYTLMVPEHLSFLATINNDHTTESLSPRLIDRVFTIVLPAPNNNIVTSDLCFESEIMEPIVWADLKATFGIPFIESKITGVAEEVYDKFVSKLNQKKIMISPRSSKAVARFWFVAACLFEVDDGIDPSIIALDYALAQKILPQLSGFGQEYRDFLTDLYDLSSKENLVKCKNLIAKIIEHGDENMKSYRFYD